MLKPQNKGNNVAKNRSSRPIRRSIRLVARLQSLASASDNIPVSEMVEWVNKKLVGEKVNNLDASNAKSKLKQAARELQRKNLEKAPPTKINDKDIDEWVEKYARKGKRATH